MVSISERIKEEVSLLPSQPGVYQFYNAMGEIIYVGKAKNLKRRVSSYFMNRGDMNRKVSVMVRHITEIRHVVVASESDALLLENNMIKNYQPRYNILLKDDKTYPWICVKREPFPRVFSTRELVRDGSQYYGPYGSVYVQKIILELVRGIYALRTCKYNLAPEQIARGVYNVCLEYHLGNCKGPCVGRQSPEEYEHLIGLVTELLKGNTAVAIAYLEGEMQKAAKALQFEQAARLKEKLQRLRTYQEKSVIVRPTLTNLDIFFPVIDGNSAYCNFMRVSRGAIVSSFTLEMKLNLEETREDILAFAIRGIIDKVGVLNREILVPFLPEEGLFPDNKFTVPQRGDKLTLLELSEKNVKLFGLERLKRLEKSDPARHTERILARMQADLYLSEPPAHIECFDNSNIQGQYPVASCVVFWDARPAKKEYRHFNIKTVTGANDFASMEEVVFRRYKRLLEEGGNLPSLVVVDGGKGQLSFAYRALERLGLVHKIALVGLAKRMEELYYPGDSVPHYLDKNSETLKVLMHMRDEAHRFGITFHRNKRSQAFIRSELTSIPGVGEKTAMQLLKRFGSISKIRKLSETELLPEVGRRRAHAIAVWFAAQVKT